MDASGRETFVAWRISKDGRLDRLVVFSLAGSAPRPVGELLFEGVGRVRPSVFRYARSWLADPDAPPLDPGGLPKRARATRSHPFELPLIFYDAGPDGWGKAVLSNAFPNTTFGMAEYLAAAGEDRVGDLGFGPTPEDGPQRFVPEGTPAGGGDGVETLEALAEAAEALDEGRADLRHLTCLLRSSADAGGARPKAVVRRAPGDMGAVAKFRARDDAFDEPRVEAACLSLAAACGIDVPSHEVVSIAGRSVLLVDRFDRRHGGERLGYMSAATLLGQPPNDYATRFTYADMAMRARSAGFAPCEAAIFRRLLFNAFINNTDDHTRNHGFLRDAGGWRLSPAFDLVPHRGRRLTMRPARDVPPTPNPAVVFAAWPGFGLTRAAAAEIAEEVAAGMGRLGACLERYEVTARDREIVAGYMPCAVNPPAFS